jgi:hypothetical protein
MGNAASKLEHPRQRTARPVRFSQKAHRSGATDQARRLRRQFYEDLNYNSSLEGAGRRRLCDALEASQFNKSVYMSITNNVTASNNVKRWRHCDRSALLITTCERDLKDEDVDERPLTLLTVTSVTLETAVERSSSPQQSRAITIVWYCSKGNPWEM